jgi:hypothetical protein
MAAEPDPWVVLHSAGGHLGVSLLPAPDIPCWDSACFVLYAVTVDTCDKCGAEVEWTERRMLTLMPCVLFRGVCTACENRLTAVALAPGEPLVRINTGEAPFAAGLLPLAVR